ncbi:lanthionine synthetase C family protein [Actinocrispum sp. NPDC049592]|uniref:lanthionine synthetase C family protein n=1 Tax=Actinocrispum sp. NPDC049592 TaxID=3154835 RepID=UPI0034412E28
MAVRRPWRAILPDDLAGQAIEVALDVARRLSEPMPEHTMESGAGCAVLFGRLDRYLPGQGWAAAAHDSLTAAVRAAERSGAGHAGLFGGLSGVAFAANAVSQQGTRYGRLLTGLDGAVTKAARGAAQAIAGRPEGLPVRVFDIISGAAGIGTYLLSRRDEAAVRPVLASLVALCGEDDGMPNWYTPPEAGIPATPMADGFPEGVFNCGLAHGVPGPMALLALATRAGIAVDGQLDAIRRVAQWLVASRADDEWGPSWPSGISMTGGRAVHPTHNAWCYGSSGLSRALWLAGEALEDDSLRTLAVDAMAAVYRRPPEARFIDRSPGLCHGLAGVLQISLRFAQDSGEDVFTVAATRFTELLLGHYDPGRRYGFGSVVEDGSLTDEPGLLDGAAGVALALLAAATPIEPDWDRMLALS